MFPGLLSGIENIVPIHAFSHSLKSGPATCRAWSLPGSDGKRTDVVGLPYFTRTITVPAFNQFSRCVFSHLFFLLMSDFFYLLEIVEIVRAFLWWICMKWFRFHQCPGEVHLQVVGIVLCVRDELEKPVRHCRKFIHLPGVLFRSPFPVEKPDSLPEFISDPCDLGIPVLNHIGNEVDGPDPLVRGNPG